MIYIYAVLRKSLEPPIISLYFASKDPDFYLVIC